MLRTREDQGWTVYVLPSSHNDIGWAGTPTEIAEHRAGAIVDKVLSLMENEPDYAFTIEAALYIREFAERRPERIPLLCRFLEEGRLECGGSYIQPYEGLLDGESLIRQLTWGNHWLKREFGISAGGYWNIDVAGRTRQLPQILARSGLSYMVLSRNQPGLYWWEAPDGSRVLTLSMFEGTYGHAPVLKPLVGHLSPLEASSRSAVDKVTTEQIAGRLVPLLEEWEPYFDRYHLPRIFLITATADYAVPEARIREFLEEWNAQVDSGALPLPAPVYLKFGNVGQYLAELQAGSSLSSLPVMSGELPNPWIYIHGPCHHKTVSAMRDAAHYLSAAEAFGAARHIRDGLGPGGDELNAAWLAYLYPDHGYGGLHGEGTDELFRQKEESALFEAHRIAREHLTKLAMSIPSREGSVRNLTVFNVLAWERAGWVECEVFFELGEGVSSVDLLSVEGEPVAFQVLDVHREPTGLLRRLHIGFIAESVPPTGYLTYYLASSRDQLPDATPTPLNSQIPAEFFWENSFIHVRATGGGLVELFDKAQRRNLLAPDHYLGFEVVDMGSPGHDVGEGERDVANYVWHAVRPYQPTPLGVERTADRGEPLILLEDGSLRTRIMTRSELSNCRVTQTFTMYHQLNIIEAEIDVDGWSGRKGRELRLMFPVGAPDATVSYDVPFGHVVVGRDEVPHFADLRPREAQTWVHAGSAHSRVTLSSSVVAHDWLDPLNLASRPVLQGVLLATKRSCHPKGPWYTQAGNHTFSACVSGGPASVEERMRFGAECRRPMEVVVGPGARGPLEATASSRQSFLSLNCPNVVVSTFKLSDSGPEAVLRCWEIEGREAIAEVELAWPVREVWACNMMEEDQELIWRGETPSTRIQFAVEPHSVKTFKLKLKSSRDSESVG